MLIYESIKKKKGKKGPPNEKENDIGIS